ncbi:MAG: Unknown protein [uncultured Sulfurovum sp.]|uniref:TVP38/TMEM64 family membrane protein n=1 Tax=uncultured Sulfurovum sp. TaxID=269237 RepID=A0A6S6SPN3_9BACT|nr:MAG: Unknown protein [uncultured Sulfurovum sp.]
MTNIKKLLYLNRNSAIISLVAILLPILGSVLSLYVIANYPEVINWIKNYPTLFFIGTAFTMAVLLTPTTFIASLSGFLFGLSSIFYVVPAYVMASLFGYFIGQYLDNGKLLKSLVEVDNKEVLKNTVNSNPFWFVIFCRISPILPFGLMNIALAAFGVKIKEFITAGTIGMLPRTLLFIWVGSTAQSLLQAFETEGEGLGFKFYLTSMLIVVSSMGLIFLFKEKMKELTKGYGVLYRKIK